MSFQDLLNRDRSVTIHHRHIQKLGIEVYKAKNNLSPIYIQEIFPERNYNGPDFEIILSETYYIIFVYTY